MIFSFYVSGIYDAKWSFHLIRGWTTSLRILWLLVPRFVHATSIISLSLRPLRARSFETRRERSSCTHAVLFDRFPSRKRATVSPVVVCRVVLSDRRARRQTKEGMLDQRLMRSRKCRREKFLGIPFYSTVAGTYIGFAVEQASIWDGSRLFTTGEQKKGWVSKGCFFDKGPFYLLFLRASNYYLLSRKNSFSHDWNCTLVERNVYRDSVITMKDVHTNFFVSNLYG